MTRSIKFCLDFLIIRKRDFGFVLSLKKAGIKTAMIERVLRLNQIFFLLVVNRDTFYLRCIPDCTVMNSRTVKKHAKNECVGLAVMFDCIYCNQRKEFFSTMQMKLANFAAGIIAPDM